MVFGGLVVQYDLIASAAVFRSSPSQVGRRWTKQKATVIDRIVRATCLTTLLLVGCHSGSENVRPSIEFIKIPPAAQGGREKIDTIAGRVVGARSGQRIIVYARSGPWWVQPWPDQPFIPIKDDSTWSTSTHLGFEYLALLVEPSFKPPATMDAVPTEGNSIVAVARVNGTGTAVIAPTVPIHFSGYDWNVRTIAGDRGGLNNLYDADNAWLDASGALHLRIKKKADRWSCVELEMSRSLGYGTYILTVRDISHLEPAAVLSMHTFDDWGGEQHYRELDVEMSQWGDPTNKNNAQFGVQPFFVPGNVAQFKAPSGVLTHSLHWESGLASFKTVKGSSIHPGAPVVFEHIFNSGVPSPGQERLQLMLYFIASEKSPLQNENEVVIERFEYLP
jgi:hypothetical protein